MTEGQEGATTCVQRIGRRSKSVASLFAAAWLAVPPGHAATPIKLALFAFELEDVSAAATTAGEAPADDVQLTRVTDEVRQLLASSGRYHLVDIGSADASAAKTHNLHDCNGCDAAIALKLGAEQSFVGVVRRISRTEYVVRFQIRDAKTGAVLSDADSGLRMGANYSWDRGARRLIKDRLLENQQ